MALQFSQIRQGIGNIEIARKLCGEAKALYRQNQFHRALEKIKGSIAAYGSVPREIFAAKRLGVEYAGALLVQAKINSELRISTPLSLFRDALLHNPNLA